MHSAELRFHHAVVKSLLLPRFRACDRLSQRVRSATDGRGDPTMLPTRVAIAGLGTIGRALARRLADGLPGLALACAATRDHAKAQAWLDAEGIVCPLIEPEAFPAHADLAVECAPASAPNSSLSNS